MTVDNVVLGSEVGEEGTNDKPSVEVVVDVLEVEVVKVPVGEEETAEEPSVEVVVDVLEVEVVNVLELAAETSLAGASDGAGTREPPPQAQQACPPPSPPVA